MPALDGLRGIAILLVMVFHYTWKQTPQGTGSKLAIAVGSVGWTGVDLFFVLSGFLITGILLQSKGAPRYFRNFYARRTLRIFPLYYGVLIALLVVAPLVVPFASPALSRLFHGQGWLWGYGVNVSVALEHTWIFDADWIRLNHFWSLAVEEHFYFIWPLLVFWLSRRALLGTTLAIVILTPFLRWALLSAGMEPKAVFCLSITRFDALALGGGLAIVALDARQFARLLKGSRVAALVALAVVGTLAVRYRYFTNTFYGVQIIGYTALAVLAGTAVIHAAAAPRGSWLHRALTHRGLAFFGKYSYGAYVFHELLHPAFERAFDPAAIARTTHSPFLGTVLHPILSIAVTMGVAVISFHLFEKHFLRLKSAFERDDAPARAGAAARAADSAREGHASRAAAS